MKKRKSWIYSVFAILVIAVLTIVLVVNFKNDDGEVENFPNQTETYAKSFSVILPETISILVGTKVNFESDYISVEPASMINQLKVEISQKESGVVTGLTYTNNSLTALSVGEYEIKFKMPKSKLTYFSKSFDVEVYEEKDNSHVYQTNKNMIINKATDIFSLFSVVPERVCTIETDNKISRTANILTPTELGDSNIKFSFVEGFVEYVYEFVLTIKEQPRYEFILNNVTNNTIEINLAENTVFTINYEIIDNQEEMVSQEVLPSSEDNNIATAVNTIDNFVKVTGKKAGQTTIIIACAEDETVKVEITVIVK
ncbi:MAG: hypothetical protein J6Q13_02520 [Clostridia bacterium]|nr:hypothetical protein [Clostridia bacterium]